MDTLKYVSQEYLDGAITELEYRNKLADLIINADPNDLLSLASVLALDEN